MNYKIIASSSKGNCVVLNNIMIDCGIPFKKMDAAVDIKRIDVLLITHVHGDHLKISTLKKMLKVNRTIKIFVNAEVGEILTDNSIKHTLVNIGEEITIPFPNGDITKIKPVKLYHDVENFGYKIKTKDRFNETTKVLYCTDTHTLDGIEAKDYNYYFLETNYTEENLKSEDAHRIRNTHLSKEQAENFFVANKKEGSVLIPIHKSSRNY